MRFLKSYFCVSYFASLIFLNGSYLMAQDIPNCEKRGYPTSAPCKNPPPPPPCSCPCGGGVVGPDCISSAGWCIDNYTDWPEDLPKIKTRPFYPQAPSVIIPAHYLSHANRENYLTLCKMNDPEPSRCPLPTGGEFVVEGGETKCQIPTVLARVDDPPTNSVLVRLKHHHLPPYAVCRYFDPRCQTCCTAWTTPYCSCDPCPPPPDPGP